MNEAGPLVKRIAGVLYPDEAWFAWVSAELEERWGELQLVSAALPFDLTDYYRDI
ncbi:MAG: DUF4416 family protein, partial [Fretibacterium sp.]|nr:DUF4416 family protein [Fretibacterium sp.]